MAISHTDAFWDHLIWLGINSNWTPGHLQNPKKMSGHGHC